MCIGLSAGMITNGYEKFLKVIQGNFQYGDPIGIGPTLSLILIAI